MKVCWLTNYYSPYKMKLFNELNEEIELSAVMLGGKDDEHRNSEWILDKNHSFRYYQIDKNYISLIKKLAKENDILIDSMYSSFYGYIAVSYFKKEKKKVMMYADGGIAIDRGFAINKILSFLMNRHDYFLSSGPHCDEYYKFYNVKEENIYHYKFTSLMNEDIINHKKLSCKKNEIKKELSINDEYMLLSVGKPIVGKGFDILLYSYIKTGLTDKIALYIVGGEPQEEIKKIVDSNNLKNVHFIGLLNSEELNKYYAASDCFILCTRTDVWGLVINEAMSFGLPVITSTNCGAGVHFNKVHNSATLCEVEDTNAYSKAIYDLYINDIKRNELGKKSSDIIKDYTIENGAQDIIKALNEI